MNKALTALQRYVNALSAGRGWSIHYGRLGDGHWEIEVFVGGLGDSPMTPNAYSHYRRTLGEAAKACHEQLKTHVRAQRRSPSST